MAAPTGTITTADLDFALDREFIRNFQGEADRLMEILDIFAPEVVTAGTSLFQVTVTGSLSATSRAEGEEVPLSKYTVDKEAVTIAAPKFYRKRTTAEGVLKSGYEAAVLRTDRKMLSSVRGGIIGDFFTFLKAGTGTASGAGLQATLAKMDAVLADTLETNGDEADGLVHFINRQDAADYLGNREITTQTVFSMTYLEDFLGIQRVFLTNKVAAGAPIVTPVSNIHVFGIDFAALGNMGLAYEQSSGGLIGVHHEADYRYASGDTHVVTGMTLFAEAKNYIVKGTVGAASPQQVSVVGTVQTEAQSS